MPALTEVERALAAYPNATGVIVSDERLRPLAYRPPAPGGGAVLLVLGDPFPGAPRTWRPKRGAWA